MDRKGDRVLVTLCAPMMQHIQLTQAKCKLKKTHKPSSMQYGPTDLHLEDLSSIGLPSIHMASQAHIKEIKSRPKCTFGLKLDPANPKHTSHRRLLFVDPLEVNAEVRQCPCWLLIPDFGNLFKGKKQTRLPWSFYIQIKGAKYFGIFFFPVTTVPKPGNSCFLKSLQVRLPTRCQDLLAPASIYSYLSTWL